jgi:hypothetical protein
MVAGGFVIMAAGAAFAWGGMALLYGAAIIDWMDPETSWITVALFFALIGLAGGVAIALLLKLTIWRTARSSQAQIIMAYSGGMTLIGIGLISGTVGIAVGLVGLIVLTCGPALAIARSPRRIEAVEPHISDLTAGLMAFALNVMAIFAFAAIVIRITYTTEIPFEPLADNTEQSEIVDDSGFGSNVTMKNMFDEKSDRDLDDTLAELFGIFGGLNGVLLYLVLLVFDVNRDAEAA